MAPEDIRICIRIQRSFETDFQILKKWCYENDSTLNTVINSFLPAIAYAVTHDVHTERKTMRRYIRADFGDIVLLDAFHRA